MRRFVFTLALAGSFIATATPAPRPQTPTAVIPENSQPSTVVVIDAGHGGFDRGGIPRQLVQEKAMNLDVAQRLKAVLTACSANGIETYFYSSQSLPLASAIHYYVAGGAPTPNRGVRRRGFYVLRKTTIPAVLVECGFLTNATEANYAQSSAYQQKLAEEIGRGIRERSLVASTSAANRLAANNTTVPLQPFIDQTHYRDPDLARSKRGKRSSKSSSKSTSSKRKHSSDADSEKRSSTRKKKSAPAQTEN